MVIKRFNSSAGKIVKLYFFLRICATASHLFIYFSLKKVRFESEKVFSGLPEWPRCSAHGQLGAAGVELEPSGHGLLLAAP